MTEPTSIDEILAIRDRLIDQRQRATHATSVLLRAVGMGLAAITYSFVFSSTPIPNLLAQKNLVFLASICGAFSVLLDGLQSFLERRSAQETLSYLRDCRAKGVIPVAEDIERKKKTSGGDLSFSFLVTRGLLCVGGTMVLLIAIGKTI